MTSIKATNAAIDILKSYTGQDPYILYLKLHFLNQGEKDVFNDFAVEYVNSNHDFHPVKVMKTVRMADWWAEEKMKEWNIDFLPSKLVIYVLIGETSTTYHCLVKYRKSVQPSFLFLSKKAVLTNFKAEDYHQINVDFDRYDKLSTAKDPNRKIKPHQKEAVKFLLSRKKCVLADDMGYGKMEPVSSLIPTPDGFKRMGDIVPGDKVFSRDGNVCNVLRTYPHKNKEIYRMAFNDGTEAFFGLDHLMVARDSMNDGKYRTVSVREMMETGLDDGRWSVPVCGSVKYPTRDGLINDVLKLPDVKWSEMEEIPEAAMLGDIMIRLSVLVGVLGVSSPVNISSDIVYHLKSKRLLKQTKELIFSLGMIALDEPGLGLRIKGSLFDPEEEEFRKTVVSIEYDRNEDAQCIAVDSKDHTYLTGRSYIVTHNTLELTVSAIEGNFDSVLIICPASIRTNWRDELLWYVPEKDVTIIESPLNMTKPELEKLLGYAPGRSGMKKDELLEGAKDMGKWRNNRFVIVNYDVLDEFYQIPKTWSAKNVKEAYDNSPMLQFIANKKSLIILDEAHRLSKMTSIRYKIIKDLIKRGRPDSIYAATGTPITNSPLNFFAMLQLIGSDVASDYNYYVKRYCNAFEMPAKGEKEKWTMEFCRRNNFQGPAYIPPASQYALKTFIRENARKILVPNGESNLEELKYRTEHIYLRRLKEDLKSIVSKTVHEVYYDLLPEEAEEYSRLWNEYERSQLEMDPTKEINKDLMEGNIYRIYLSKIMVPRTIKLVDKLIESGEKVVIACCFDDELYTLKEYYGDKCVIYNGKMLSKQKDKAKERFDTDPECKVFIGNMQAAGVGLTLVVSSKLVFNDMSYVPGDNFQMQDRVHRINQTRDVDIYYQIFRNTQYQKIWEIVMRKQIVIDTIIKREDEKDEL